MKRAITLITGVLITVCLWAQSPNKMSYQAVIRNSSGQLVVSQSIGMRISILKGSATGTLVYMETKTATTNSNGLVSIEIGGGTGFDTLNWGNGMYFIKTETDPAGGANYSIAGTSQLLSVPYALYAKTSGNSAPTYSAGSGIQINGSNIISTNINLAVTSTGDTLKIVPGNYVIIPGLSAVNAMQPYLLTSSITAITSTSANCGYTVNMSSTPAISARGICWGTGHNPDIGGLHTTDGPPYTGTFTGSMTTLLPNTVYYVRAYATNSSSTYYGGELSFVTIPTIPSVNTNDTTTVAQFTATAGGNVTDNGGANVIARGVCWSISQSPTVSNPHTSDGTGAGNFNSNITGLNANTLYYYRAYASNSAGTGYGVQKSYTTDVTDPTVVTDTIIISGCNSAVVTSYIPSAGSLSVNERGICYHTNPNPTIWNTKIANGSGTGSYNVPIPILAPNTTYYVRSYATTNSGTTYGNQKTFSTSATYYAGFEGGLPSGWVGNWAVSADPSYEGNYCLKSVDTGDVIQFTKTITTSSGGQISFFHQSSEWPNSTHTQFFIDNILVFTTNDESWTIHTIPVTAGSHTFKWKNMNGGSGNKNRIDYVIICP